jgi:hypothetical protein
VKKIDGGQGKRATIAPGKKRRLPSWSGPTVAQVITVLALLAWTFVMAYLGPDYLNPTTCTFGGTCPVAVDQGPPKSTFASSSRLLVRRSEHQGLPALPRSSFPRLALSALSKRQGVSSDKTLNPDGWAPFNDPLVGSPSLWDVSVSFRPDYYFPFPPVARRPQLRRVQELVDILQQTRPHRLRPPSPRRHPRPQVLALQHLRDSFPHQLRIRQDCHASSVDREDSLVVFNAACRHLVGTALRR